jgi:hypothetical protein
MCLVAAADITTQNITGTSKQPVDEDGTEKEVETVGFKLTFHFKQNPYFNNTVSDFSALVAGSCDRCAVTASTPCCEPRQRGGGHSGIYSHIITYVLPSVLVRQRWWWWWWWWWWWLPDSHRRQQEDISSTAL